MMKMMLILYDYTSYIGATGTVTKSLRKNPETIPGKHSIDSLYNTAILGTSHTIRKYCSVKLEA
jgi:hypothetical protein